MKTISPDGAVALTLPSDLLPSDGRFGSGPSKIRPDFLRALAETGISYLGTSHRQPTVKNVVHRVRHGLRQFYDLPDDYEVVLGTGGATAFWGIAAYSLIVQQSQHLVLGEFSKKFATEISTAPHLASPDIIEAPYGECPTPRPRPDIDTYALIHCETSTGVRMPIARPTGKEAKKADTRPLVLVDATSAAGGMPVTHDQYDVYYFSPQKAFGSDGGLWLAFCSPAALKRAARLKQEGRWAPLFLDLTTAVQNSQKDQTCNTPPLSTLFLLAQQIDWMNRQGGIEWAAQRCTTSASLLYEWAEKTNYTSPFVADPDQRSHTVATIDFDAEVDHNAVCSVLRANGILDVEPYRKLGRNQIRVALFPAIEPADIEKLIRALDYTVQHLASHAAASGNS